jgi:hypothetical protein
MISGEARFDMSASRATHHHDLMSGVEGASANNSTPRSSSSPELSSPPHSLSDPGSPAAQQLTTEHRNRNAQLPTFSVNQFGVDGGTSSTLMNCLIRQLLYSIVHIIHYPLSIDFTQGMAVVWPLIVFSTTTAATGSQEAWSQTWLYEQAQGERRRHTGNRCTQD